MIDSFNCAGMLVGSLAAYNSCLSMTVFVNIHVATILSKTVIEYVMLCIHLVLSLFLALQPDLIVLYAGTHIVPIS